ncbi:MAG TPA: hypothetical protein VF194_18815 [Ferrovibrio sp.]|uniref:hypothetical protein n=1 Tax=Ferrovibrio sp. TaxID=1917215 RepID=UPI002ED0AA25
MPHKKTTQIHCGRSNDYVHAEIKNGILFIEVVGAPTGPQIEAVIESSLAGGWIGLAQPCLVDVSRFSGIVDWTAIRAVANMAKWGPPPGETGRIAYVVGNPAIALLVKGAAGFFPRFRHRVFHDRDSALHWLAPAEAA